MTVNGIHILNIYHMLAYAFKALREGVYANMAGEDFDHAEDLFGQILSLGLSHLLKRGLHRMYEEVRKDMPGLRGKIDMSATMGHVRNKRQVISCIHDEFTVNNTFNQILKSTALALIRTGKLSKSGESLKRAVAFLGDVDTLDIHRIRWSALQYERNNQHYLMLINICKFVIDGLLLDESRAGDGRVRSMAIDEGRMASLYEGFIREYFARHYDLHSASKQIAWDVPQGTDVSLLPKMQSDVMLTDGKKTLIIDAKFYGSIMQENWERLSYRNSHLYQILAYVNNQQALQPGKPVDGLLLYAKTSEAAPQPAKWPVGGHDIAVRILDLSLPFAKISEQLDGIAKDYFNSLARHPVASATLVT